MLLAMVLMVQFSIPQRGTLGDQLGSFYRQSGIQMLAFSPTIWLPARNALSGKFEVLDGLCHLVQGMGVYVKSSGPGKAAVTGYQPLDGRDECHPCPLDSWNTPECVHPPKADWSDTATESGK